MLEAFNHALFLFINATPDSPSWLLYFAHFCAKYLILVMPLSIVMLWLWGPRQALVSQRVLAIKTGLALIISILLAWLIGHLFPNSRPFAAGVGYNFLHHAADNSFPSNHGTVSFTFACAFLSWHRLWSGILVLIGALAIAWSRIYLGVHWPLDMIAGALTALCGCLSVQLAWQYGGVRLLNNANRAYRYCFALPIRKGWVKN